jgi:hypothetical protein
MLDTGEIALNVDRSEGDDSDLNPLRRQLVSEQFISKSLKSCIEFTDAPARHRA